MRDQVSFYLDRARAAARAGAAGAATEVEAGRRTADAHVRRRSIATAASSSSSRRPTDCASAANSRTSTDLIGNLLDNAGKWARTRIVVHAEPEPTSDAAGRLYFTASIDDDGPGLDEEERSAALERGRRLDESRPARGSACRSSSTSPPPMAARSGSSRARSAASGRPCACRGFDRRQSADPPRQPWRGLRSRRRSGALPIPDAADLL